MSAPGISDDIVRAVFREDGLTQQEIAEKWGVPLKTVTAIRSRERHRRVTEGMKRGKNADRRIRSAAWRQSMVLQRKCTTPDLRRRIKAASQMKRDLCGAQIFDHPRFAELLPSS